MFNKQDSANDVLLGGKSYVASTNPAGTTKTFDTSGLVVSKVEVAPGVYEMEYTLPKGKGREPETKTVYDPAIYSDTQMSAMASEAAARAQIQFQATGVKGQYVQIQGVWFYAPVKTDRSGKVVGIKTVFPKRPQE